MPPEDWTPSAGDGWVLTQPVIFFFGKLEFLPQGIKLDDLSYVKNIVQQGDWMTVNDFDSGYWHVPIHKDSWQNLRIHFIKDNGSFSFRTWRVLVLGIINATHIFTRLPAPFIAWLRREGIRCLIYIDNFLSPAAIKQLAIQHGKREAEPMAF